MLETFFSVAARKAWVSGIVGALLTPVISVLADDAEVNGRTLLLALANGVISALAVFATTNTPPGPVVITDEPGEHAAEL